MEIVKNILEVVLIAVAVLSIIGVCILGYCGIKSGQFPG